MRTLFASLLFALPAAADGPPVVIYAGPIRQPAAPPAGVAVRVTEYRLADGRKVAVVEWVEPLPRAAACPTCGPACRCGPACGCDAGSWLATCAAAPVVVATGPAPPPVIPPATPARYSAPVYPPPVYVPPVYYRPIPRYRPVFPSDVCGPGGCPGSR